MSRLDGSSTGGAHQAFNGTNPQFWAHEFEKHATCEQDLPPLSTQFGFFNTTLSLYFQVDLLNMLAKGGIVPGPAPVATSAFLNAVSASWGFIPAAWCNKGGFLESVVLCMDKQFNAIPCSIDESNSCGASFVFPAATKAAVGTAGASAIARG